MRPITKLSVLTCQTLLVASLAFFGCSSANSDEDGSGGSSGDGGSSGAGVGGSGTGGSGGGGTTLGDPVCGVNSAGDEIKKDAACTSSDPQICYRTCGPASSGWKPEICTAGFYDEGDCDFPEGNGLEYSCYSIPSEPDAACPTDAPPQATVECDVAACTPCNLNGIYHDSAGVEKTGYCVCAGGDTPKWTCASDTAWPCPGHTGCE